MGMTDSQWYGDLRNQLDNWEQVKELLEDDSLKDNPAAKKAMERVNKNISRIKENLEK
ncbi:MAG: hypothetical protein IJU50_02825 [Lachnospiraceae bacterium]|nr:hypothetical protein [Lachnospiraceae bacterium]